MEARLACVCALGRRAPSVSWRADEAPICAQGGGSQGEKPVSLDPDEVVPANRLLARLPAADRQRFLAACEPVALAFDQVLTHGHGRMTHAYFPTDAIVSLSVAATGQSACLEVALIGWEGMIGLPLLLGAAASALRPTVVRGGFALRIAAAPLRLQLLGSEALASRMQRYVLVSLAQMAQAAFCTRYHRVDQRLARLLLMTQDRVEQGAFHATHEFLAATLGVRRAGVTRAAAELQRRHLIVYRRGVLTLLDRDGLQAVACGCYAADCASYATLMRAPAGA